MLSYLLFAAATFVAGCAVLGYGFLTSLACGYAPSADGCHGYPWQLNSDDQLWLVKIPAILIICLVAGGVIARRQARRGADNDR